MFSTNYKDRKISLILMVVIILILISATVYGSENTKFSDVQDNHWAVSDIYKLRDMGIINGTINEENEIVFGIENKITRVEFLAMLVRLVKKDETPDVQVKFLDVNEEAWYYEELKSAISSEIVIQTEEEYKEMMFQPNSLITREEMAKMIVRALGYDYLAHELDDVQLKFQDVKSGNGYIDIAKSLGIVNGKYNQNGVIVFEPDEKALRVEAVAMISRMNDMINNQLQTMHGFYAISSYSQISKLNDFDSIGFGWSALEYSNEYSKVILSTKKTVSNDYYIPDGYTEPFDMAVQNNIQKYLMVYANNSKIALDSPNQALEVGLLEYLLNDEENQQQVIDSILNNVTSKGEDKELEFEGIILDFEGLKDRNQYKEEYSIFLKKIKEELNKHGKNLIVCLHPIRSNRSYFDGYDYNEIGKIADKVIIMAHDYNPQNINDLHMELLQGEFPLAPIEEVYDAVKNTVDAGIPKEKIILQISLNKEVWALVEKDNSREWKNSYIPYIDISDLIKGSDDIIAGYNEKFQSPFIFAKNEIGELEKSIWYEDTRSVRAKVKLAKNFGLSGISVWRLGLIGDESHDNENKYFLNVWSELKNISK